MDPDNSNTTNAQTNPPVSLNGVQVIAPNPGKRAELLEINRQYWGFLFMMQYAFLVLFSVP
jgi:hypothetical protein